MSLWQGRAPKMIGAAALALAVLAAPGSSAFARAHVGGHHGGYHHRGGYRGGYGGQGYGGAGDLSFRCNVDYRGTVTGLRIRPLNNGYRS